MCGIAGWTGQGRTGLLERMITDLSHRGPDETGMWANDEAALGIARLSIIDVREGHQPVFSNDRNVVAVCNGEIYNFRQLADELVSEGVALASGSDVEIIPHLYERYGFDFVHRLRGMFAIAMWDIKNQRLILARDRVGKKPLTYAIQDDELIFASEARGLLAFGLRPEPDLHALDHLLAYGYLPIDSGAYQGLCNLPPGCIGVWEQGELSIRRYWEWQPKKPLSSNGLGQVVEEALEEAVKIRMVSERPVGSFLSGGIDSTIVTALMARNHSGPVKTFSVGFADSAYDESGFARGVAEYLGTEHTELIVEPDPVTMLERVAEAFDQPFADSSAVPMLMLSELASQNVVVALSGDGGDEAFGGYKRYVAAPMLQRLNFVWRVSAPALKPESGLAEILSKRWVTNLNRKFGVRADLGARYRGMMEYLPLDLRQQLWTCDALQLARPEATLESFTQGWASLDSVGALRRMRAMDFATYLPGDLLVKLDTTSMAHSLEVRSPFLDQEVLTIASRLPEKQLVRGLNSKWLLRQLAYRLVPRELVDRPKRGFSIPRARWLRGPLREVSRDLLLDSRARQRGWFNVGLIECLLDEHDSGVDRDLYIWPLLMIEVWARRWLDSPVQGFERDRCQA